MTSPSEPFVAETNSKGSVRVFELEGRCLSAKLTAATRRRKLRPWVAATYVWSVFVNHYMRDLTGALQREIEHDMGVTTGQFHLLNSCYFASNIVVPILAGVAAHKVGLINVILAAQVAAGVASGLIGCAGAANSYLAMLVGRIILGLTYEIIGMGTFNILRPYYLDMWTLMVGINNVGLRGGSVLNFFVTPAAYSAGGLRSALGLAGVLGLSGLAATVALKVLDARARGNEAEQGRPLRSLTCTRSEACLFTLFCMTTLFAYSSLVPFLFTGNEFIREKWGYGIHSAGHLMALIEGFMIVCSPFIGALVDRFAAGRAGAPRALGTVLVLLAFVAFSYALMVWVPAVMLPPAAPIAPLGVSWAGVVQLIQTLWPLHLPDHMMDLGSGMAFSSCNVGPTIVLFAVGHMAQNSVFALLLGTTGATFLVVVGLLIAHSRLPRP